MWEGLARTERQDRVLHGTAKLANVLLGIVLLPLWLFGQLVGGRVRDFLVGLERRSKRPRPVPPERERTMDALMGDLQAIPEHLRHSDFAELRKGLADISNFVVAQNREGAVIGYRYPGQFKDHIVEGADGERIAASIALQEAARPSLIVVHGLFTNSRFDYVRQIAVRAFYEWGFNVAALDLRSFGMTELTSPAPSTAGWKEGLDILALARYMKELGGTSVGALGISLGGSSVLNASDQAQTPTDLDGGILAVSPPAVPKLAWERLSEPVPRGHPRYPIHKAFEAALISRVRSGRWPPEAEDMLHVMEYVSAPYYNVDAEEIWTEARGIDHVAGAKVPLLVLHPEDDGIVKVEHARMLQEAAKDNDLVRIWVLPAGSHGLLEAADPRWTHAVYRTFFERWATYAERTVPQTNGGSPELVYSSQEPGSRESRERRPRNGQRNLEAIDLGQPAGGHWRARDRRRAPALGGHLAARLQRGTARVTDGESTQSTQTPPAPPESERSVEDMTVGELVFEVSDQASVLIREEIELAKTEVTEKFNSLLRGSVAGLVAGVFALLALALAMNGFAWLLNDLVFDNPWAGFFVEAAIFLLIGAAGGLYAYRSFKNAAPPMPDMAIEEAKEIKAAFDGQNGQEDAS